MLIKSNTTKTHEELDFDAVVQAYPAHSYRHALDGSHVTSPFHIFSVETLRDQHHLRGGPATPTDVFVWAIGEPERRDVTKVGGLPYWPTHQLWPERPDGEPCQFLAQINFTDSTDLVPELPGDILLVFAKDSDEWMWGRADALHLAWQKVTPQPLIDSTIYRDLMSNSIEKDIHQQLDMHREIHRIFQDHMGQASMKTQFDEDAERNQIANKLPFCCYGIRHRTFDYPGALTASKSINVKQSRRLPIIEGTKIGGAAFTVQDSEPLPGQLLCQLASVQAAPRVSYPWANREQALMSGRGDDGIHSQSWLIGDMGSLYFSIDNGMVYVNGESY